MPIEPMLTEETPANALVARVLAEAGIEMVFGISGGHTGRIVTGLSQVRNSVRTILVREESLAGVMAETYGRLTRRPGVMLGQGPWVLGNGLIGTIEAHLSSSPMLLLTDFSDAPRFSLHAPYQQGTGDWGSWDAPRLWWGDKACRPGARPGRSGAGDPARAQTRDGWAARTGRRALQP